MYHAIEEYMPMDRRLLSAGATQQHLTPGSPSSYAKASTFVKTMVDKLVGQAARRVTHVSVIYPLSCSCEDGNPEVFLLINR